MSPTEGVPGEVGVVELRTYNVIPGKLPGLVNRFIRYQMPIFARHGIGVRGPWVRDLWPGHQMFYLLEFPSEEERELRWAAYRGDPEMVTIRERFAPDGPQSATIESTVFHAHSPEIAAP